MKGKTMTVIVKGDHPIFKRPDKVFENETLAKEFAGILLEAGFDNVVIEPLELDNKQKECLR